MTETFLVYVLVCLVALLIWIRLAPRKPPPQAQTDFERSIEGHWGRIRERADD